MNTFRPKGTQAFCNKCGSLFFTLVDDINVYDLIGSHQVDPAPGTPQIKTNEDMFCQACGQEVSISRLLYRTPAVRGGH